MRFYDVIIIGGGLVGAGFAAALRETDLRIAVVDARLPASDDPRLFALNAGSCDFLRNIGIWPVIASEAASIRQVHVSSRGHFGAVRLKSEDVNLPFLGNVIPACVIEAALNAQMTSASTLDIYRPATLSALEQKDDGVDVVLSTQTDDICLYGKLIIGADGTESTVRKLAGIQADVVDYRQSAIVTRTQLARSHHHIAYERFTDNGTIAMLPLCENECATIWSGKSTVMDELMQLNDDDFTSRLQQVFGYRLGRLLQIRRRHTFPLRMMRAKTMTSGNVFLLGNAAHTLHPVAAQGFNLAVYEAAMLAEAILKAVKSSKFVTQTDLQMVYDAIRQQQSASISISHQLAVNVSAQTGVIRKLLPYGLTGFDLAMPLRRQFIRKIMGRTGRVPRLLMSENA